MNLRRACLRRQAGKRGLLVRRGIFNVELYWNGASIDRKFIILAGAIPRSRALNSTHKL
jgi:hypothetical protein